MPPPMLAAVLADCKEEERIREVFAEHHPRVVFHAAAYKHVGLMEENPVEAVHNNALATRVVANVAGDLGARQFVLVSTDKAVSPATVMGASKALAEFALEAAAARFPETRYAAVRFGNVLGSSGSVVPIFRNQIERGGPVTVTDERMTRYFMTIPEAVQLIIRSGSLGRARRGPRPAAPRAHRGGGPEVFVLDMGEPGAHPRPRARDDRALGTGPGARHPHRDRRPARGREAEARRCSTTTSGRGRRRPRRSCSPSASRSAGEAVEAMFDEIGLLVARRRRGGSGGEGVRAVRRAPGARRRAAGPRREAGQRRAASAWTSSGHRCACAPRTLPGSMTLAAASALDLELVDVRSGPSRRSPRWLGVAVLSLLSSRRRASSGGCASGQGAPRSERRISSSA